MCRHQCKAKGVKRKHRNITPLEEWNNFPVNNPEETEIYKLLDK
jgi:hypothetical protein